MFKTICGVLVVAAAMIAPAAAGAAPATELKCSVTGQIYPSASIVERGTITYSCSNSYFGSSLAVCRGQIFGSPTSGTCSIGPLTVVRCEFKGSFVRGISTSTAAWTGDL